MLINISKVQFLFLILIVSSNIANGQASSNQLSEEALKEDLQILRKNLETKHPELYAYTTKAEMDAAFQFAEESIFGPMTSLEFYRHLARLQKLIGNGHTILNPSSEDAEYVKNSFLQFPFDVYWNSGTLYILKNGSDKNEVSPEEVIRSINGEAADDLFKSLMDQQLRDGYNTSLPARRVMNGFRMFYAYFKGSTPTFQIELVDSFGLTKKLKVAGLTTAAIEKNKVERYGELSPNWRQTEEPALSITFEKEIANLKVRSFSKSLIKRKGQRYKQFFKEAFQQIASHKMDHLILDLRGNDGGNAEIAVELFSYLNGETDSFYNEVFSITKKIDDEAYDEKVVLKDFRKDGEIYRYKKLGAHQSQPSKYLFTGALYVLTDAYSFSATGFLAGKLKNYNRAIFIGEETGGNPNQNTSGPKPKLTLPHSKVNITVPLIFFKTNVDFENTGRGVLPDHLVRPSIEDILEGNDTVLDYTKELIRNIAE